MIASSPPPARLSSSPPSIYQLSFPPLLTCQVGAGLVKLRLCLCGWAPHLNVPGRAESCVPLAGFAAPPKGEVLLLDVSLCWARSLFSDEPPHPEQHRHIVGAQ